jgi:hypothetical protein
MISKLRIIFMCTVSALFAQADEQNLDPVRVELVQNHDGSYQLLRNGEAYNIRGAGGPGRYQELADAGGNSTRTWGVRQLRELDENGLSLLDHAHKAGISVVAGIWVHQVRHGFDYTNTESLQKQRDEIREAVREFRHHPAILIWGLGNEIAIATSGDDPAVWTELNELAKIVREEDPYRPIMTVVSGTKPARVHGVMQYAPEIDILGVNSYGGGGTVPERLNNLGWTKPFIIGEFGPRGHWEVPKTDWGAPLEPTAEQKAKLYLRTYQMLEANGGGNYLGSYAFLWGNRQEVTPTWFSMFLETGEKTPSVDYMSFAWTGEWPKDRAPIIEDWEVPFAERKVNPNEVFTVDVSAINQTSSHLEYEWWVLPEREGPSVGGDAEKWLTRLDGVILSTEGSAARLSMPAESGAYRLYLKVSNQKGGATVRNTPFFVK